MEIRIKNSIDVYTDASWDEEKESIVFVAMRRNKVIAYGMHNIFRGDRNFYLPPELSAMYFAIVTLKYELGLNDNLNIYSDSKSNVKYFNDVNRDSSIKSLWIKGHTGEQSYNWFADRLTKVTFKTNDIYAKTIWYNLE